MWSKKELDLIEKCRDLVDNKNYAGILTYIEGRAGLKIALITSALAGDSLKALLYKGEQLIFKFRGGPFYKTEIGGSIPKNPGAAKEFLVEYVDDYLEFGLDIPKKVIPMIVRNLEYEVVC